ncbi:MAG: FGGY-family carbohydrate kinase [Planctomycetota bacterium]|jgi:sugar (pentulose or hexulose) kinase|nr:FGGY-family carbohydrate kinase [Planctomycetota bacterium]
MNNDQEIKQAIAAGNTFLGIELGSTRIKAVLVGPDCAPIASGGFDWENRLENGHWTYSMDDVWKGMKSVYASLAADVKSRYGAAPASFGAIGISAMMHGYLPFDADGNQLAPFRTWRNTTTEQAAAALSEEFDFNVPQRWSIAHLYQAILNGEPHVGNIAYLTTLAGYVHWKLTGEKVIGVGDASGMFPIDSETNTYDAGMTAKFGRLVGKKGYGWTLGGILPRTLVAGEDAGRLTAEGAKLLDPAGVLKAGIPLCPPEGDAGTGMVATNSVSPRTGNVSAGTSIFAMIVLDKSLSKRYLEIDMVTTPTGKPVAMAHCNSCTSDLDAWLAMFGELLAAFGANVPKAKLYDTLYFMAMEGAADGGGMLSYNYYSGEPITGVEEGRPLFVRMPDSPMKLATFARVLLYSTVATLKIGMDILDREHVKLEQLLGHGGLFKTKGVGQRVMAAALNVPVAVMESAGEGGAWGIALLAAYMGMGGKAKGEKLDGFLAKNVFATAKQDRVEPDAKDREGFLAFMDRYVKGLEIQKAAVRQLRCFQAVLYNHTRAAIRLDRGAFAS